MTAQTQPVVTVTQKLVSVTTVGIAGPRGPKGDTGDAGVADWGTLANKPLTFPPSTHSHDVSAIVYEPGVSLEEVLQDFQSQLDALSGSPVLVVGQATSQAEQDALFDAGYAIVVRTDLIGSDSTAPTTISAPAISSVTSSGATLSATINENGTGYYLIQAAGNPAPNVAAVLAAIPFGMIANTAANVAVTSLSSATGYDIYFVAEDVPGNAQSTVQKVSFTTAGGADSTAPVTVSAPFVAGVNATGATLYASINENGTGYYLVQAAAAAAPNVAAVLAGTPFAMTSNVLASVALSSLTANTAYKVYFVAKDTANNAQSSVQSVSFTTDLALTTIFADSCDSVAGWTHQAGWNANGSLYLNNTGGASSWGYRTITGFSTNAGVKRRLTYDVTIQAWAAGTAGVDHTAFYLGFGSDPSFTAAYSSWYVVGLGYVGGGNGYTAFNNLVWNNIISTANVAAGRTYQVTIDVPGDGRIIYKVWDKTTGFEASYTQNVTVTLNCLFANLFGTTATSGLFDNIALSSY